MAIFHCSTKLISRSSGRSAVAAAAYRSGSRLHDERTGNTHDYSQRSGVVATVALLPNGDSCNRSELWNAAESAEKRKDARTAREWIVALPNELNEKQRLDLATEFSQSLAKRHNVAVDLAIHTPDKQGDQRNHHAHILTTTRCISIEDGKIKLNDKSDIELSNTKRKQKNLKPSSTEIKAIRKEWADLCNQALEENNHQSRVDHRTLAEQGIDREPTQHVGVHATAMERKGQSTERGDINREIKKNLLSPERLEKLFEQCFSEAKKRIKAHQEKLQSVFDDALNQHGQHEKKQPEAPTGIFARFKQSDYQEKLKKWEEQEKQLRHAYIEAKAEKDHFKADALLIAGQLMKEKHPEAYQARERLKDIEKKKASYEREKALKERKKQHVKRSGKRRRRGGFGL